TATADDQNIYQVLIASFTLRALLLIVEQLDGARDIATCAVALHPCRRKENVNRASAPGDDVKNVANGGACWRSDHADAPGKNRQRPFSFCCKQSLSL